MTTCFAYVGLANAVAQVTVGSALTKHVPALDGTELYDFDSTTLAPVYLGRDAHDDVTWTAGSTGAVASTAAYDPFGNLVSSTGSVPPTRWQSSYQDTATSLYYVVARWYSPVSGRFLSSDSITQDQTDPQSRDPYAYGAGDPVDGVDPDGRCTRIQWEQQGGCPLPASYILDTSARGSVPRTVVRREP